MKKHWYELWFDSPYYHLLYRQRNEQEARAFIDRLIGYLAPEPNARMLDMACGRGRYSRFLAAKGYQVTGLDLSLNSIEFARQFEAENLSFFTQDMRKVFRVNYFDYTFSFFTSFGYFNSEKEDFKSLKSVAMGLQKNGIYVLDFFNAEHVMENLVPSEVKVIEGVEFRIKRWIEDDHVFKNIRFTAGGKEKNFTEKVSLFRKADFERFASAAGMNINRIFGDYYLTDFAPESSSRMILIMKKE